MINTPFGQIVRKRQLVSHDHQPYDVALGVHDEKANRESCIHERRGAAERVAVGVHQPKRIVQEKWNLVEMMENYCRLRSLST